jgi:hypothetical protein
VFAPQIPRLGLAALAVALAAGCPSCLEQPARPITIHVKNALNWPVFVRDEDAQAGVQVLQYDRGAWTELSELAPCACQECTQACESVECSCAPAPTWARRIDPGKTADRVWSGEYRSLERVSCFLLGARDCLGDRVAAQAGSYRVKLCWAATLSAAPPDSERFRAEFPTSLNCTTREFQLPAEGVVEVQTVQPPGCRSAADCATDELCLDGRCSATCLPNDVPALGSGDWTLEVGSPDDAGFFQATQTGGGATVYRGAGKVASVRYSSGTTNLVLTRTASGVEYTASLYYVLPGQRAFALSVGEEIDVTLVEYASGERKGARAIALRQAGQLLLLADNGRGGRVLDDAQSAPFSVGPSGDVFACGAGDCGRRMFRRLSFAAGSASLLLAPGKADVVEVAGQSYEAVAVASYSDEVAGCGPQPVVPYAVVWQRPSAP